MTEPSEHTPDRYYLYDQLRDAADSAARMCALYTDAGLYDLAKERAKDWRVTDLEARMELYKLVSQTLEATDPERLRER